MSTAKLQENSDLRIVRIPGMVQGQQRLISYPLFRDVTVQPGETKDLGDVKPQKSQRPPAAPTRDQGDSKNPNDQK